jgi:hypothetical protein
MPVSLLSIESRKQIATRPRYFFDASWYVSSTQKPSSPKNIKSVSCVTGREKILWLLIGWIRNKMARPNDAGVFIKYLKMRKSRKELATETNSKKIWKTIGWAPNRL